MKRFDFVALAIIMLLVVGLIAVFAALPAYAGAEGGAKWNDDTVKARDTDTYQIRFVADEEARVRVTGDGDIDLYIYDENNNLIESDFRSAHWAQCSWTPKWTGMFTLRVRNCETRAVPYRMETN